MAFRFLAVVIIAAVGCGSDDTSPGGAAGAGGAQVAGVGGAAGVTGVNAGGAEQGDAADRGDTSSGGNPTSGDGHAPAGGCTTSQPFSAPRALTELNTPDHEAGPRLTPDELMIAYLCIAGTSSRICIAQRSSRTEPFGKPLVVVATGGGVPWLSDDGLLLIFEDDTRSTLNITRRTSISEVFPTAGLLLTRFGDPYVVGGPSGRLYLSDVGGDLNVATLREWIPQTPALLPGVSITARAVRPVMTPDELTMYFGSPAPRSDGGTGLLDIWMVERKTTQDAFASPANVSAVNTSVDEFPGWISPDGCRLYFDSGMTTRDLYVAERGH